MFLPCQRVYLTLLAEPNAAARLFFKSGQIYSTRGSLSGRGNFSVLPGVPGV